MKNTFLPQSLVSSVSSVLNEALASPAHKGMATKAARSNANDAGLTIAEQTSQHIMPLGKDRLTIPLNRTFTPDREVVSHLESKGYKIHDYEQGLATHESNPARPLRIGRVLNQIDAPNYIKGKYEKDPARQGIKSESKASIVISRKPSDVAAMSTHQNWTSCQTLGGKCTITNKDGEKEDRHQSPGLFSEMVPAIVASGAHIAYLVHKPEDIDKHYGPIARTTLNTFKSHTGHTILRPSEQYGDAWEGFHSSVKNWAEHNFPAKDPIYVRHAGAYPEGEQEIRNYAPEHDDFWKGPNADNRTFIEHPNPDVLHHHALTAVAENNAGKATALSANKNISDESMDHIVGKFSKNPHVNITRYIKNPHHIQRMLDDNLGSYTIARSVARNDNTTSEQLHHIVDTYGAGQTNVPGVRQEPHNGYSAQILKDVTHHKNADDSHFSKIMELGSFSHPHGVERYMQGGMDHMDALESIAGRTKNEDIGKKILHVYSDPNGPNIHHGVIHSIAKNMPHLLSAVGDQQLNTAYSRHPRNDNLEKEMISRGNRNPGLLNAVAMNTNKKSVIDALTKHHDPAVAGNARSMLLARLDYLE